MQKSLPIVAALMLAFATPSGAQEQVAITADRFVVEENASVATFSGDVAIVQGSLNVTADTVVVHYGDGGASDIESLEAIDNVVVDTPGQHVTGNRGKYDPDARVMIVTGNVVAVSASGG